jgi:hypothetical protein
MRKTKRKTVITLALIRRVVGTLGFDGAETLLELLRADATPEQAVAELMPFIEREARRRKAVRANA